MVRARGLQYGGREFETRSLHLKPETNFHEERGLSGCRKGLKTVPLAQALLSLKPAKTPTTTDTSSKFVSDTIFQKVWCIAIQIQSRLGLVVLVKSPDSHVERSRSSPLGGSSWLCYDQTSFQSLMKIYCRVAQNTSSWPMSRLLAVPSALLMP